MLFDRFSRHHTYLRISLTEKCSLRCVYCMPEDGVNLTPSTRLLSTEEMLRLARVFVGAGVTKIRLTGGEPTVRPDLAQVVASLSELRPLGLEQIAMTSNGIALPRMLPTLVLNGLDKLNLSLDTLDRDKFKQLTRRDGLKKVREQKRCTPRVYGLLTNTPPCRYVACPPHHTVFPSVARLRCSKRSISRSSSASLRSRSTAC